MKETLILSPLDLKRRSAGVRTLSFCWCRLKSNVAQGGVASSAATGRRPGVRGVWWSSWSAEPANVVELCSILQEITSDHPAVSCVEIKEHIPTAPSGSGAQVTPLFTCTVT